jgi:hypothetical protein
MSEFNSRELEAAHKKSFQNEPLVRIAHDSACFCCLEHFPPSEIDEWVDDKLHRTAMCPKCGVDSVLTEETLNKVSDDLLKALQKQYFATMNEGAAPIGFDSFTAAFEHHEKEMALRLSEADLIHADRADKATK